MNSLQWLAWQAEKAVESGLDTCVLRRAVSSAERLSDGEPRRLSGGEPRRARQAYLTAASTSALGRGHEFLR